MCHNDTLQTCPIAIQHVCGCSCLGGEDKAVWTKEGRLSGKLMPFLCDQRYWRCFQGKGAFSDSDLQGHEELLGTWRAEEALSHCKQ